MQGRHLVNALVVVWLRISCASRKLGAAMRWAGVAKGCIWKCVGTLTVAVTLTEFESTMGEWRNSVHCIVSTGREKSRPVRAHSNATPPATCLARHRNAESPATASSRLHTALAASPFAL